MRALCSWQCRLDTASDSGLLAPRALLPVLRDAACQRLARSRIDLRVHGLRSPCVASGVLRDVAYCTYAMLSSIDTNVFAVTASGEALGQVFLVAFLKSLEN